MSERGSFVTEYMSCPECRKNVIRILTADNGKSFKAQQIEHWSNKEPYLPILAGKVGSSYTNGEVEEFINQNEGLSDAICHSLTVTIIADSGDVWILEYEPGESRPDIEMIKKVVSE